MKKKTLQNWGFWAGVVVLTALGFWLRFADLGVNNFQNDEFFHLEAAVGYLETGQYALWDFGTHEVGLPYTRAWIYTWQVAQSFQWFGVNEFAARLPSVIWGVLLLPLMGWLAWRVTQSRLAGVFAVTLAVFDQSLIWSARTSRMYSMFIFLVCLTLVLVVEALLRKPKWWVLHPAWLAGAVVTFLISYMAHETALALGAGVMGVTSWLIIDAQLRTADDRRWWLWLGGGVFLVMTAVILVNTLIRPILPNQFFTLRNNPNWEYGLYLFNQMRLAFLGWPLLGVAVWATIRFKRTGLAVLLGTALPIIFFFVFIGNRYPEKKYILFVLPMVLIAVAYGIERTIWLGIPTLVGKLPRWLMISAVSAVFVVIGFVPSWPGLAPNVVFQRARADDRPANAQLHDFATGYALIESKLTPQRQVVLIQGSQPYYWTRTDLQLMSMGTNKEFTKDELEAVYLQYPHGLVVWPKYKAYHLKQSVRTFFTNHMKRVKGSKKTNLEIFVW